MKLRAMPMRKGQAHTMSEPDERAQEGWECHIRDILKLIEKGETVTPKMEEELREYFVEIWWHGFLFNPAKMALVNRLAAIDRKLISLEIPELALLVIVLV